MTKKKVFIIAGTVVVVAVLAGLMLPKLLKGGKEELVAETPPVVTAQKPEIRTIEINNELIGTIEPDSIVHVTPLGSGEVTNVAVKTGDTVTAGQLLCVIDTKQVESTRIAMETAKITYGDAKSNLDRLTVLHAAGDVADADYQNTAGQVEMARLQYENAKIAYNIQLESSQVTAPISGKVESFNISLHDMISPQTSICVISGDGGKSLTFYVSERIISGLKAGDVIRVEKNGTDHEATITEVTSVKLYVTAQKAENVLTVPVDSVYYEAGNPFIYTYLNGTLKKNAVTIGLTNNEFAEVQSGINADDQVVTTWTSELYDGSKVTLAETAAETQTETQAETETTQDNGSGVETSASAQ